jgi:glycine cleavage system pyridoxal-binding protein P
MTTVDVSELRQFGADLREAAALAAAEARRAVTKAGVNIKRDARANLRAQGVTLNSSLSWLPVAVSYDIESPGDGVTDVVVGPDQAISGLGVGVEFGSSHHAPMPFLHPAFDAEVPRFNEAVDTAVLGAFMGRLRG